VPTALLAWIFFEGLFDGALAPYIHPGLNLPPLGEGRGLFSCGNWGRSILVALEFWVGGILALFVAIFSTGVFSAELSHREPFWATPFAGSLRVITMKLLAISSIAATVLLLGAGTAFLNPTVRNQLTSGGKEFLALYLVLAWVRIGLWATLSMFLFWLTNSRWLTIGVVEALHILGFVTVFISDSPNMISLIHRNFLAWNFVDAFAPLGIIPGVFFLQGFVVIGIAIILTGASIWVKKRRFPAWQEAGSALARRTFVLGIVVLLCAVGGIVYQIQRCRASFTASEFFVEPARLEKPFIWSREFNLLVYPGQYMAMLLPSRVSILPWIEEVAQSKQVHRYEYNQDEELPVSLILVYPKGVTYPPEMGRLIMAFLHRVAPLLIQAQVWLDNLPETVLVWPAEAFVTCREVKIAADAFLVPRSLLVVQIPVQRWEVAWALTAPAAREGTTRVYLAMYLMANVDKEEVERALERLDYIREGREVEFYRKYGVVGMFRSFYEHARAPGGAEQILCHWQRGEELGHENYVRKLLEGRDDQG
jgi:hypothetical protein